MPLPHRLARFNRRVTNRVLGPLALVVPGFAQLEHVGRRSGDRHRTPVMVFGRSDRRTIALTYGPRTEWAQNVLAAGGCTLVRLRARVPADTPRLYRDPERRAVPRAVRWALRALRSSDFLELQVGPPG